MENAKKAYKEILKLLKKYESDIVFDVNSLIDKAECHLFGIKLVEKYGFDLDPKEIYCTDWQELMDNMNIGFWDGKSRTISCSDDGRQPKNEILLSLKYPTGPYMFGDDYPIEFFEKFLSELKTYKPKYIDSTNKSLYFSLENAGKIHNAYRDILKRHYDENKEDIKQRKIKKMKEDLEKLENS